MKNRRGAAALLGILALGAVLATTSCGPNVDLTFLVDDGNNGGNANGTGVGPVSGFGSVNVNGVHYDVAGIDDTRFFDDHGRTKTDLLSGMMVKVTATGVDDVSGTGTATRIEVQRHVDGPLDDNGVTLATGRMKVMGQTVATDTSTVFDDVAAGGLVDLAAIDNLARAGNRPELEIHGFSDNTGVIHATFVHMWDNDLAPGRGVQGKGTVSNLNPARTAFTLGTVSVSIPTPPAGLADGVFVEVKGTFRASDNTLLASGVTVEDPASGQSAGDLVKAEGYVNRVIGAAQYELAGPDGLQRVNWTTATTAFKDGMAAELLAGARIVVEGKRNLDRTVAAKVISFRKPSDILLVTVVTAKTPPLGSQSGSLTLFGTTVFVNALTRFEDGSAISLKTFGFDDIVASPQTGDTLEVSAFLDNSTGTTKVIASRIERIDAFVGDRHILKGTVDATAGGANLTILGITVQTTPGATEFLQADGTPFPGAPTNVQQQNFFAAVTAGQSVVKALGSAGSPSALMTASEVRIEPKIGE